MVIDLRAVAAVFVGGGIGSLARYSAGLLADQRLAPGLPVATFTVNIVGSFIIGAVAELAAARMFGLTPLMRTFIITGLLGGFTTFSSFSLDMVYLATNRAIWLSCAYAIASIACGFIAAFTAMVITRTYIVQP